MLTMIIQFDGVLNGTEQLLASDMNSDPSDQQLGIVEFQKQGLLGRIDPDLVFAGDERHEGYRLDMVQIQQQNLPVTGGLLRIVSADGFELFQVLDLLDANNLTTIQQDYFIPPGYQVELVSDAPTGGFIIRLGLVPLLSPVDWKTINEGGGPD